MVLQGNFLASPLVPVTISQRPLMGNGIGIPDFSSCLCFSFPWMGIMWGVLIPLVPWQGLLGRLAIGKKNRPRLIFSVILLHKSQHSLSEDIREAAESWILSGKTGLIIRRPEVTEQKEVQRIQEYWSNVCHSQIL